VPRAVIRVEQQIAGMHGEELVAPQAMVPELAAPTDALGLADPSDSPISRDGPRSALGTRGERPQRSSIAMRGSSSRLPSGRHVIGQHG